MVVKYFLTDCKGKMFCFHKMSVLLKNVQNIRLTFFLLMYTLHAVIITLFGVWLYDF